MSSDGQLAVRSPGPNERGRNARPRSASTEGVGRVRILIAIALGTLMLAGCAGAPSPSAGPQPVHVPFKDMHREARQDALTCRVAKSVADFAHLTGVRSRSEDVLVHHFVSIYENRTGFRTLVEQQCYAGLRGKPGT